MHRKPRATQGLDVNETEDGLVIYTAANDKVHHLNNTAAVIFQLCDGSTDEAAIVAAAHSWCCPAALQIRSASWSSAGLKNKTRGSQ